MNESSLTMRMPKYVRWLQEQVMLVCPRVQCVRQPSSLKSGKQNKQIHYAKDSISEHQLSVGALSENTNPNESNL